MKEQFRFMLSLPGTILGGTESPIFGRTLMIRAIQQRNELSHHAESHNPHNDLRAF